MKNAITILMCAFCLSGITAQNGDGPGKAVLQRTPELKALYAKELALKNAGDVAGLEANQKAIIAAWQEIDSTIAVEFQPIQITETEPFPPLAIKTRPYVANNQNLKWTDDLELDANFVSGVDVDLALSGTIYVASYENRVRYGLGNDAIRIYKSTNDGVSFSLWGTASVGDDITKMKMTLMDSGRYQISFYNLSFGGWGSTKFTFQFSRSGPLDSETINTGIKDFDIDVDYSYIDNSQLFAVYIKANNILHSARSNVNSTGFGWSGEYNFGDAAKECAFTYGKVGTYVAFIGLNTGNFYFAANTNFNDPTGWETPRIITEGDIWDTKDISMAGERMSTNDYSVLVISSQKLAGDPTDYFGTRTRATEGDIESYSVDDTVGDLGFWDAWCRKEDDNKIIKASFGNKTDASCNVINYNDGELDDFELVSDNLITVERGSSAVAEDADGNAIAVYIGPNSTGLYFDSNSNVLGVNEIALKDFVFYPNPASSTINLKAKSIINNVAVYNLLGQQVFNQKMDAITSEINVSGFSSGTYIMKVTIGSETGSYKIIKN